MAVPDVLTRPLLADVGPTYNQEAISYVELSHTTRSEFAVPLEDRTKQRLLGVMNVESTTPHAFSRDDLSLIRSFADLVSTAWSNALAYQTATAQQETKARQLEKKTCETEELAAKV